jgi:multiple sugar transport system substrate-binding protein
MMSEKKQSTANNLSRRDFLKTGAAGAAALATGALTTMPASAARRRQKTPITYVWPFAAAQSVQQTLVDMFNEQSDSIEVELQIIPQADFVPTATAAFAGGEGPDVLAMSPAWLTQFAAAGFLENMEDWLASEAGLLDTLLPIGTIQGRMYTNTAYMAGLVVDTYPLFYNTAHFEEAGISGPPTTLDEFHDIANQLTDADNNRYGYYQLGGNAWAFQQWSYWLIAHGGLGVDGTLYDEDGVCIFRNEDAIAGLDRWLSLFRDDQVSPPVSAAAHFNDAANAFNAGQVSMAFGFLGYIANFSEGLGRDSFGVAMQPEGPMGQFVHYGANGIAMGSASENKEAAWEFAKFLLQPDVNVMLNEDWGSIPSTFEGLEADYLTDPVFDAPKAMVQLEDVLVNTPRQFPEWANFFVNDGPENIQRAMLGESTAEEFAAWASDEIEAMAAANA